MSDTNELNQAGNGLHDQLQQFQVGYRETLRTKYGLDAESANAIPLGTAQQMEEHAKLLQQAANNRPGRGDEQSGATSSRSLGRYVDRLLVEKYSGPNREGGKR